MRWCSSVKGDVGLLLSTITRFIGIKVINDGFSWVDIITCISCSPPEFHIYLVGWAPDYNDPSNYINPLFSHTSFRNAAKVNDSWLETTMIEALGLTNESQRCEVYEEIQHYIVEDLMPWAFLYTLNVSALWNIHMGNVSRNVMHKVYFYHCSWEWNVDTTETSIAGNISIIFIALFCTAIILIYRNQKNTRYWGRS